MPELVFQLYSARNTPLADALPIIADAGYTAVETSIDNIAEPQAFLHMLQQHGLRLVSVHATRKQLRLDMHNTLELAEQCNVHQIVCPGLPLDERPTDKPGWLSFAEELAGYTAQITATNRNFAWHNHDYDMLRQPDGCMPIRLLLDSIPDMCWQLDTGWITTAGQEPAAWLRTYADRISAIHVKDVALPGTCKNEDGWADVDYGSVNWQELIADLSQSECDYLIAEHDNPSDLKRFATRSIRTMQSWF